MPWRECKAIGRSVVGFTAVGWDAVKQRVMFEVVLAKFEQNEELADLLIGTGEKILVEASPYDDVWGAGMSALEILSGKEWDGENLLGVVLEKVRVVIGPTDDGGVASLTPAAETSREQRSKERGLDSDAEAMELMRYGKSRFVCDSDRCENEAARRHKARIEEKNQSKASVVLGVATGAPVGRAKGGYGLVAKEQSMDNSYNEDRIDSLLRCSDG